MMKTSDLKNGASGTSTAANKAIPLRPAAQIMTLARIGSFHQSRLSFMRVLLRRLKAENWQFKRSRWNIISMGSALPLMRLLAPSAAIHWLLLRMIYLLRNARIGSLPRHGTQHSPCMMASSATLTSKGCSKMCHCKRPDVFRMVNLSYRGQTGRFDCLIMCVTALPQGHSPTPTKLSRLAI